MLARGRRRGDAGHAVVPARRRPAPRGPGRRGERHRRQAACCSCPCLAAAPRPLLPAAGAHARRSRSGGAPPYGGVVRDVVARQLRCARSSRSTCDPRGAASSSPRPRRVAVPARRATRSRTGSRGARPRGWRNALLVLVILPFWTSFLVRMYAWIVPAAAGGRRQPRPRRARPAAARTLLYNDFAVMLGQVYGELPFMIIPLYVSLEKLDRSLLEAAADLGADARAQAFGASSLPQTMPGHRGRLRARLHPVARRLPRPRPPRRRQDRLRRQPRSRASSRWPATCPSAPRCLLPAVARRASLLLLAFRRPLRSAQAL